jgi:hypothetical protein
MALVAPLGRSLAITSVMALLSFAAEAQTTTPGTQEGPAPPSQPTPEGRSQPQPPALGATPRSGGVVHPPAGIDPGMSKPPPNPQAFPTPIVPPPAANGDRPVVPK